MTPFPDLVIFLPGIGGSVLSRGGRPLWGGTWRAMANAVARGGLTALRIDADNGDDDLGDGIEVEAVVDGVHVLPGLWKIDAYGGFCSMLVSCVGLTPGENFVLFPYDWRRDNRVSARRLQRFIGRWLPAWREKSGNADARVVLIAHSMGGLVARHYVECLEGWRTTRRLFTIGTPHRGSLDALGYLVNGYAKRIGPLHVDATLPLRSFASVHQLLPTFPCVESGEGLLRVSDVSIANVLGETVHAGSLSAAAFHSELADAATGNEAADGYAADHLSSIASARQPTFQSACITTAGLELRQTIEGDDWGGDGTVPMVSAVPAGMDPTAVTHVWGLHSRLTSEEGLQEHMLGALRAGRVPMERFRSPVGKDQVRLQLEDAYEADVGFDLIATLSDMSEQTLAAEATRSDDGATVRTTLHRSEGRYVGPITLPQGAWWVKVSGARAAEAEDVVLSLRSDGTVLDEVASS